eukprot:6348792-Lingulodinium_polyedra.AAC.1
MKGADPKGKGKGKYGNGKGKQGKGYQQFQGKGFGYQGQCFNCGKIGHKQWECPENQRVRAVEEEEDENGEGGPVPCG